MQVINTNVMSLNAQRNLSTSGSSLATSIQRLSSGLRINSAKDDAAGLAIASRFTTQIRGLDQAARNANDGISLSQTAEGALGEIGNNLQRIRELAVQSSNATNSSTDREALQAEVNQLLSEINRVANQTSFNGTKLLDGSFTGALFQVGADSGQTIGVNKIVDANTDAIGAQKFAVAASGAVTANASVLGNDITFAGGSIQVSAQDGTVTNYQIADFTVKAGDNVVQAFAAAINDQLGQTGLYAEAVNDTGSATELTLTGIKAGNTYTLTAASGTPTPSTGSVATFTVAANADTLTSTFQYSDTIDISDFVGASRALEVIDKALQQVNTGRADMGAVQNRFQSVITNLATTSENLSASRSRIMDADFAKETAELTRAQILQQAGTAMLAQANAAPQNVLSLLG